MQFLKIYIEVRWKEGSPQHGGISVTCSMKSTFIY